jgi:hypothetical protein
MLLTSYSSQPRHGCPAVFEVQEIAAVAVLTAAL